MSPPPPAGLPPGEAAPRFLGNLDAVLALLLVLVLITLAVTGLLLLHAPDPRPAAFQTVPAATQGQPLFQVLRTTHGLAVSALFGLVYLRLATALFRGRTGWAWLGWWSLLLWSVLLALTGEGATARQGDYWISKVMVSLLGDLPGTARAFDDWSYWHLAGQDQWMMMHAMLAAMLLVFGCGVLGAAWRRVVPRLAALSWPEWLGLAALAVAIVWLLALAMAGPSPLDNPDNALPANLKIVPNTIMPDWYLAPWLSLARSGWSRPVATTIVWAALLGPSLVASLPLRRGGTVLRIALVYATGLLVAAWIELAILGRQPLGARSLGPVELLQLRALATWYFAYFLLALPGLALLAGGWRHKVAHPTPPAAETAASS